MTKAAVPISSPPAGGCPISGRLHLAYADDAIPIRMRSSEVAQAVLGSGLAEFGASELLVLVAIFDNERVAWIRWAGECEAIADLDAISGLTPATRTRLQRVFEAAEIEDDQAIQETVWPTRWHDIERW